MARGPHPTASTPEALQVFKEDIDYQVRAGFCKVISWEDLTKLRPKNLKISPVACIPQTGRRGRIILDLLFPVFQEADGVVTAMQASVNDTTVLQAPSGPVKEIGKVLPRLLQYMRDTPAGLHIVFSKLATAMAFGNSSYRGKTAKTLRMCCHNKQGHQSKLWSHQRCKWDGWRARPCSAPSWNWPRT